MATAAQLLQPAGAAAAAVLILEYDKDRRTLLTSLDGVNAPVDIQQQAPSHRPVPIPSNSSHAPLLPLRGSFALNASKLPEGASAGSDRRAVLVRAANASTPERQQADRARTQHRKTVPSAGRQRFLDAPTRGDIEEGWHIALPLLHRTNSERGALCCLPVESATRRIHLKNKKHSPRSSTDFRWRGEQGSIV